MILRIYTGSRQYFAFVPVLSLYKQEQQYRSGTGSTFFTLCPSVCRLLSKQALLLVFCYYCCCGRRISTTTQYESTSSNTLCLSPNPTLTPALLVLDLQAICFAAVFEFLGALLLGSHVTKTIRKGIADVSVQSAEPFLSSSVVCVLYPRPSK